MKQIKIMIIGLIVIFIISFSTISFSRFVEVIYGKASVNLKRPIFLIENLNTVQAQISSINNNYYETNFNVLNYISENDIQVASEIDFEYTIKIIPNTFDFPVKYKLINLNTNQEVELNSELETSPINLGTELANHNYKLIVQWDLDNTNQNFEENLEVRVLIKGVQKI